MNYTQYYCRRFKLTLCTKLFIQKKTKRPIYNIGTLFHLAEIKV